jgi:Tfp pilus assembly protein PilF/peroxiredoxin
MGAANAASLVLLGLFVSAAGAGVPSPQPQDKPQDKWEILDTGNDAASKSLTAARVDLRNERYDEAIKGFKKAAEQRNGQCVQCYVLMAQAYSSTGKVKDAAAAVKQAIALNESDAELYNQLGVYLYRESDKKALQESAEAFQRAIDLSKGQTAIAYFNLGHALIKLGKEKEGIQALNSYIEADPSSTNAGEARAIIANPRLATENLAPGFNVRSIAGEDLSLNRLKGKIVLLDFWATWCGPCLAEMPSVKELWKKYRGDQFVILGISLDRDRRALDRYLSQEGITWPQVYDRGSDQTSLSRVYGVHAIPHTVLLDQDGVVRAVGLRGGALSSKVGELIKKLSKQASHAQSRLQ